MWWTRPARNALLLAAASAALTACATGQTAPRGPVAQVADPKTPLDQYAIAVSEHPEELALGLHAAGLSPTQRAALHDYVARWRQSGTEVITVQAPLGATCGCDPRAMGRAAAAALSAEGVPPSLLRVADYEAGAAGGAPVLVRYNRYAASTADCSARWGNLVSTFDNKPSAHFGCTLAANYAAMVADPRDLLRPVPTDPADGLRRSVVLDKYRQGVVTSSARDSQASGTVSSAVN